jgi:hypothetical protein
MTGAALNAALSATTLNQRSTDVGGPDSTTAVLEPSFNNCGRPPMVKYLCDKYYATERSILQGERALREFAIRPAMAVAKRSHAGQGAGERFSTSTETRIITANAPSGGAGLDRESSDGQGESAVARLWERPSGRNLERGVGPSRKVASLERKTNNARETFVFIDFHGPRSA